MPMEQSILKSTKKNLGLDAEYHAFDLDVMTHINKAFFDLYRLGIGPAGGYSIDDDGDDWPDFLDDGPILHAVKTYVYLTVRLIWDPPSAAHHVAAAKEQIVQLEHTMLTERELAR